MDKKRVMIMTDSPRIKTGFANVGRHVASALHNSGRWDVHYVGWFDNDINKDLADVPYRLYTTARDQEGRLIREDQYAYHSFGQLHDQINPDVVWICGDSVAEDRMTIIMNDDMSIELISFGALFNRYSSNINIENGREYIELSNIKTITVVDGEAVWRPLEYISRHYYKGNLAKVRQRYGESICTYNHSLIDSEMNEVKPSDMPGRKMYQVTWIPRIRRDVSVDMSKILSNGDGILTGKELKTLCRQLGKYVAGEISNDDLTEVYHELCGIDDVRVPNFIYNLHEDYILEFTRVCDSWATTSLELVNGLSILFSMLGECLTVSYSDGIYHIDNSYMSDVPETTIDDIYYDGYVYDLTVADGHTFIDTHGNILHKNTWMSAATMWHYSDKDSRPSLFINYVPIDSDPCPYETKHSGGPQGQFTLNWPEHFKRFDEVIAYGEYGMDQINARCKKKVVTRYIHHGTDIDVYKPLPKDVVRRFRSEVYGVGDDDFLIVTVARNQPRKSYPEMLAAIKIFIDKYETNRKVYYVPHAPLQDVGWNFEQLILQSGLTYRDVSDPKTFNRDGKVVGGQHRVIIDKRLVVGSGPSDAELNMIYNAADMCLFIYTSEGWALPPHEAMAAGTPTIMTEYSAPADWARGKTVFVKPKLYVPEPITNLRKAYHDPNDIADAINKLYKNNGNIMERIREAGLQFAKENDWKTVIQPQWLDYFDNLELKESSNRKEVIYLSDADSMEVDDDIVVEDQPKVSIIIPTLNGGTMLDACINSIRQSSHSNVEIIIVDNGTWDKQSLSFLDLYRDSGCKIVEWRRKYSPAKALNLAAKEATGDFILFLDNDTIMSKDGIDAMVKTLANDNIGVVGLKMQHPKNSNVIATGFDYDNRLGMVPSSTGEKICQKFALSGTCMMMHRMLFNVLGGYDERFNLIWQDVDLCLRIRKLNKLVVCNTDHIVYHIGGATRRYISKAVHTIDYYELCKKWWPEYITRKKSDQHRVAVVKLVSLGDCIICSRMMKEIRKKYKDSYITLYTTTMYEDIFKGNPYIDEIKTVGPVDNRLFGPAWSLMLYDSVTFNVLSTEGWDVCIELNQLDHWMEYRREPNSMVQSYANMIDVKVDDDLYDIHLDDSNHQVADDVISKVNGSGPLIVMHTTAGWDLKEWNKEGFIEIAKRLHDHNDARIIILGANEEEKLDSEYVMNVGGSMSIRDQVALLSKCDLFIGCDSGPLHMAKAANCPILALFGCTSPDVVGFKGIDKYIALQSPYAGEVNCGFTTCPAAEDAKKKGQAFIPCTNRIPIDDVWNAAIELLGASMKEYRKGSNRCETYFKRSEWRTRLLEGEDPSDMCKYS